MTYYLLQQIESKKPAVSRRLSVPQRSHKQDSNKNLRQDKIFENG